MPCERMRIGAVPGAPGLAWLSFLRDSGVEAPVALALCCSHLLQSPATIYKTQTLTASKSNTWSGLKPPGELLKEKHFSHMLMPPGFPGFREIANTFCTGELVFLRYNTALFQ